MKRYLLGILFITLLVFGCQTSQPSDQILSEVIGKIQNASNIQYTYRSITDNKFNDTKYFDTAVVTYYKLDSSLHGFGLKALSRNEAYIFDGHNFEEINHDEKTRIQFDQNEIIQDSSYFHNFSFFASNPLRIKEYPQFDSIVESIINNKRFHLCMFEENSPSKSDSSKIVRYQKTFFIEADSNYITQFKDLTIRNDETLQIVDHFFSNYKYQNKKSLFPKFEHLENYKIIQEADIDDEFTYTPVKVGEKLSQKNYLNLSGKEVSIYGENQKPTLIMFSFIGCAPCEIALNDFKDADYWFKNHLNVYYSSFQNNGESLKEYLKKKDFPFDAFGKESNMIADFSLYHAPSFVFIDPSGKILKVVEGYDDEVQQSLFDLIIMDE